MAKKLPVARSLTTTPGWTIPKDDHLPDLNDCPNNLLSKLTDYHAGLERMELESWWFDLDTKQVGGTFQHFKIRSAAKGQVPDTDPEALTQIVFERCYQYAEKKEKKVTFVVHFFGTDADGKKFEAKTQFKIDGTPEEDDENDEPPEAEEETIDEFESLRETATDVQYREPPRSVPVPRDVPGGVTTAMTPVLADAIARSPVMQEMGVMKAVKDAYGGALAEHRALANQVRIEQSQALRDMKSMFGAVLTEITTQAKTMVDFSMDQVKAANARAERAEQNANARVEKAEQRVVELSRLDTAQFEGMMGMAQQGWAAFLDGLKMKADSIGMQQEYDRAFMGLQIQGLQSGQRKSATGSALVKLLPFAASGLVAFLRNKGDERTASMIEGLTMMAAHQFLGGGAAPPEAAHAEAPETTQGGPLPPLVMATRQLYDSLRPDQIAGLQRVMPKSAWGLLQAAADTDIEAACFACLVSMQNFLQSDQSLQVQVVMLLDPPQQAALMQIVGAIQGQQGASQAPSNGAGHAPGTNGSAPSDGSGSTPRRAPPRPGATPPPPVS